MANERRRKFEDTNGDYIQQKISCIFEPMIINLLNQQPTNIKAAMKEWLLVQFNTTLIDDEEINKPYVLQNAKLWRHSEQFAKRSTIAQHGIPRSKIEELRAEINELKLLKKDMVHVDQRNVSIDEAAHEKDLFNKTSPNLAQVGTEEVSDNMTDIDKQNIQGMMIEINQKTDEKSRSNQMKNNFS